MISSPGILAFAKRDGLAKYSSQSELRERSYDKSATNPRFTFPALFSDYRARLFLTLSLQQ